MMGVILSTLSMQPAWAFPSGTMEIHWLHILALMGCALAVLVALALWVLSMALGWRGLQRKCQQTLALKLSSESNLATPFQLRVEMNGLEKKVRLIWLQDGERLKFTIIQKATYIEEALPPVVAPQKGKQPRQAKPAKKSAIEQEYQKVSKFANLLASIASTLASLLPGSLKGPFANFAASIRKEQQAVGQVKADKDRVTSSAKMLDSNVKQLGSAAGKKKTTQPGAKEASGGGGGFSEGTSRRLIAHQIRVVFTRPLEPREISQCTLIIRPRAPFRDLTGDCQIAGLPVEAKEFPAFGVLKNQVLNGRVDIKAPASIYLALYGLLCAASLTANAVWCFYVVQWLAAVQ